MPSITQADWMGTGSPTVTQTTDATESQLGGPLDRETKVTLAAPRQNTNLIAKTFARLFFWFKTRIYRYYSNAFYIPVTNESGSFYTFTAGTAWTSDGSASGTFIEDGVASDGFVKVLITSGTFNNGDTVEWDTGTHTADSTAAATQRGDVGSEGEWGVVHELPTTLAADFTISGLHPMLIAGVEGIAGFYRTGAGTYRGFTYDPDDDVWTDGADQGALANTTALNAGVSRVIGQAIVQNVSSSVTFNFLTVSFNPTTSAFSTASGTGLDGIADAGDGLGFMPCEFNGRIFVAYPAGQDENIRELTGGSWAAVGDVDGSGSNGIINFDPFNAQEAAHGTNIMVFNGKMYLFAYVDQNGLAGSRGVVVLPLTITGSNVTADNARDAAGGITTADDPEHFGQVFFPGTAIPSYSTGGTDMPRNSKIRFVFDQQTNGPDGQDLCVIYVITDSTLGSVDVFEMGATEEALPTVTIDWTTFALVSGTTWEVDVTAGTPSDDVSVDEYLFAPDDQLFRVITVDDAGSRYELKNVAQRTLASTGTSNRKFVSPVSLGIASSIGTHALSHEASGGGGRSFVKDEKGFLFRGFVGLAANERIDFKCEGGGTVDVDLFHGTGERSTTQSSLTTLTGGGSLVGDTITAFPADGTLGSVQHDLAADSITNGTVLVRAADIT